MEHFSIVATLCVWAVSGVVHPTQVCFIAHVQTKHKRTAETERSIRHRKSPSKSIAIMIVTCCISSSRLTVVSLQHLPRLFAL